MKGIVLKVFAMTVLIAMVAGAGQVPCGPASGGPVAQGTVEPAPTAATPEPVLATATPGPATFTPEPAPTAAPPQPEPNIFVGGDFLVSYDDNWGAHHPLIASTPPGAGPPEWWGTQHVVWDEQNESDTGSPHTYEIHYSQSLGASGGRSWSNDEPSEGDKIISSTDRQGGRGEPGNGKDVNYYPLDAAEPSVAVDLHGFVHVIWRQMYSDGTWEIIYSRSMDNGMHWTGFDGNVDTLVSYRAGSGADTMVMQPPVMTVSNDWSTNGVVLHVVWMGFNPAQGRQEIYYSRSPDGGMTWTGNSADIMLSASGTSNFASYPAIATAGPNGEHVCVVWTQRHADGSDEIFRALSHNYGATWLPETPISRLAADGFHAGQPAIAGNADRFLVAWPQQFQTGLPPEIMHGLSSDYGTSWSSLSADQRISFPDGVGADNPSIAIADNGYAYATWLELDQNAFDSTEVHVSHTRTVGVPTSWSGYSRDEIISNPDANSVGVPADTGNVSVAFAYVDGTWRPRAVWDEPNYTVAGRDRIAMEEWEIITSSPVDISIPVILGWNLVSAPLIQEYPEPENVFNDGAGDGLTTFDRLLWWDPNGGGDKWKQFNTGWDSALNDLLAVNLRMGLWINITSLGDGYMTVTGKEPTSTNISLKAGWNLVGYPAVNDTAYTVSNLKTDTGATTVEGFSTAATYRTQVLTNPYILTKGEAYWVYVPSDITWCVDW